MKTIYLIRHGKTIANEKHLYCGFTDLSLSSDGIKELVEIKHIYNNIPKNSTIITTSLKRTNETASILFNNNYIVYPRLKEMNFGLFEMKSYDELKNNQDYINWINDSELNICPEGESSIMMKNRVIDSFIDILNLKDESIVIICHGGTIYHIMNYLFKDENKNIYEWQPQPGLGYEIQIGNTIEYKKIRA